MRWTVPGLQRCSRQLRCQAWGRPVFSLAASRDFAAHGDFDERAREQSLELWASLHGWLLAIGILGVTGGFYAAGRKQHRSWCEKIRDLAA